MAKLSENILGGCARAVPKQWSVLMLMLLLLMALLPAYLLHFTMPKEGWVLDFWWAVSFSASKYGLAWVGLLMALLVQPSWKRIPMLLLPILLFIGGAAWMNEHLLKPAIAEPRPSIGYLADAANGGVLEQGVQAFYLMPDKASRSAYLEKRLEVSSGLQMPELLREHWVEETGYSFPSGHAFAASALAGWFIFLILCAGRRHWLLPVFWGWVVAVCYSRVLLGVHRPEDVLAGTVEGVLLAALTIFFLKKAGQSTFVQRKVKGP